MLYRLIVFGAMLCVDQSKNIKLTVYTILENIPVSITGFGRSVCINGPMHRSIENGSCVAIDSELQSSAVVFV